MRTYRTTTAITADVADVRAQMRQAREAGDWDRLTQLGVRLDALRMEAAAEFVTVG